jgi:hypothetical protein
MVESHCDRLKDLFKVDALIMTKKLMQALQTCGVSNIDFYDTIITHPKSGFSTSDYVAGNLLGLAAATDLQKSTVVGGASDGLIDVDFKSVSMRDTISAGLLMFRLAENTSAVIVHSSIRDALVRMGFTQLSFIPPSQWMG